MATNPSTFLIQSTKNSSFGTGFCIHQDANGSYLVTCYHVIEACDTDALKVKEYAAKVIASSEKNELIDLAVIYVQGLTDAIPLKLSDATAQEQEAFTVYGYRPHKQDFAQEPLTGAIKKSYTLESNQSKQWIYELRIDEGDHIEQGYSGSAIISTETDTVIAIATDRKRDGKQAFATPAKYLKEIWKNIPENIFVSNEMTNPYKGLHSFTYHDRHNYFGREKESQEIAEQLKDTRLFTLLGASGSGKSSLIFAGIRPLIEGEGVEILSLRPQSDPFKSLATVFIPTLYTDELERLRKEKELSHDLRENSITLPQLSEHFLQKTNAQKLYLVIDQFEELFTLTKESKQRNLFLDRLLELINSEVSVTLLIAMRADFMGQLSYYEPFNQAYNTHPNTVLSLLDKANLQKVIEQPALSQGVTFQDGLVDRIIDEIENEAGQLPLLEFALDQLWENKQGRVITHDNLDAMTSISHSISHYADNVYAKATDKESIKKVLIKLVNPGSGTEDTRRIASLGEFGEEERATIVQLANERLIVTQDNDIDIVHEALIREWGQLKEWIEEYREFLEWEKLLRDDRKIYVENGEKKEDLLQNSRLLKAEEFLKSYMVNITQDEKEFIKKSIKENYKKRQKKQIVLGVVFIVLFIIIGIILSFWNNANKTKKDLTQFLQQYVEVAKNMCREQDSLNGLKIFDFTLSKFKSTKDSDILTLIEESYLGQGVCFYYDEEYNKSMESFQNALKINPNNYKTHRNIGIIYLINEKYDKALQEYKKSLDINQTSSSTYINIFELQLIQNKTFDHELEKSYIKYFQYENTEFIDYEMLKVFYNIVNHKDSRLESWKQKYTDIKLDNWNFDKLDEWISLMENNNTKNNLLNAMKVFKEHSKKEN